MVSPEEKQRRKVLFSDELARRERQSALKEELLQQQAERAQRTPSSSGFQRYAEKERQIQQEARRENTPVIPKETTVKKFSFSFGGGKPSSPKADKPKLPSEPSGMGIYIFLIILSGAIFATKYVLEYSPLVSLLMSIGQALLFFIAAYRTSAHEAKIALVAVALILDIGFAQGLLDFLPDIGIKSFLLTIHIFAWVILAVIFFLMGMSEVSSAGQKIPASAKFIFLLIIGVALFFLLPYVLEQPLLYQEKTHAEYYSLAKAQVQEVGKAFSETKNVWTDTFSCTFQQVNQPTLDKENCLKEKRIVRFCVEQFAEPEEQQKCQKELREGRTAVAGIVDPTIKLPTKAEFVINEKYFPKNTYRTFEEDTITSYSAEFKMTNPRKQVFNAEFSCYFTRLSDHQFVPGKIIGPATFQIQNPTESTTVVCEPDSPELLDGKYKLIYNATMSNLISVSRLQRAFIDGDKTTEEKNSLVKDILAAHFPGKSYLSQAPADFVRINFAFGNPQENPIIEGNRQQVLSSTLESAGSGRILRIRHYKIDLPDFELLGNEPDCLEGFDVFLPASKSIKQAIYLPTCLVMPPAELQKPYDYIYREFLASVEYDYAVSKEVQVEIFVTGKPEGAPEAVKVVS